MADRDSGKNANPSGSRSGGGENTGTAEQGGQAQTGKPATSGRKLGRPPGTPAGPRPVIKIAGEADNRPEVREALVTDRSASTGGKPSKKSTVDALTGKLYRLHEMIATKTGETHWGLSRDEAAEVAAAVVEIGDAIGYEPSAKGFAAITIMWTFASVYGWRLLASLNKRAAARQIPGPGVGNGPKGVTQPPTVTPPRAAPGAAPRTSPARPPGSNVAPVIVTSDGRAVASDGTTPVQIMPTINAVEMGHG